jgi:DNA polymerase III alpha subunit (gram-positive type)
MAAVAQPDTDKQIDTNLPTNSLYIFTDIETESLKARILLQIAAVTSEGEQFNIFIDPKCKLSEECTKFSGFVYDSNTLYRDGLRLQSFPIQQALQSFMNFLSKFNRPVILVFHNGFTFDCEVLARFFTYFNIQISPNILTVADTLPYVRIHLKAPTVKDHKLTTLAEHFNIHYAHAHDALSDSLTLRSVTDKLVSTNNTNYREIFKESCRPFSDYINKVLTGKAVPPLKKKPKKTKTNKNDKK